METADATAALIIGKGEIIALLVFMVGIISAAVAIIKSYMKKEEKRLERFENAHEESQKKVVELHGEIIKIRAEYSTEKNLCKTVLEAIDRNVNATS